MAGSELPTQMFSGTKRKALSPKQKMQMFLDHGGVCCLCKGKIDGAKEAWIDEHILPLAEGGSNDLSNRGPAHEKCARKKTSREATDRSRMRRAGMRHHGVKDTRSPAMAGTKRSGLKRTIDGRVINRETGEEVGRK